jgi:hypothetical protein
MKLSFRQGIVKSQVDSNNIPSFLLKEPSSDYITLYINASSTVFTASHGEANYLYEEANIVSNAWGPFTNSAIKQFLYWDIDLNTGIRSFGNTILEPIVSASAPPKPSNLQHWFNTTDNKMYVFDSYGWDVKLRVFAGTYTNGHIEPYYIMEPLERLNNKKIDIESLIVTNDKQLSSNLTSLNTLQFDYSTLSTSINDTRNTSALVKVSLDDAIANNQPSDVLQHDYDIIKNHLDDLIIQQDVVSRNKTSTQQLVDNLTKEKLLLANELTQIIYDIDNGVKNYLTSQVGNYDECLSGFILFDDSSHPVTKNDGTFLTTESQFYTTKSIIGTVNFDTELFYASAIENIPAYSIVSYYKDNSIAVASCNDNEYKSAVGFIRTEVYKDEVSNIVSNGYITNIDWHFSEPPSTSVYLGLNGTFQTIPPSSGFIQKIGTIVSQDTILISIDPQIIYNTDNHTSTSIPINVDIISGKLYTAQSADAVLPQPSPEPNVPIPEPASSSQIGFTYVQNTSKRIWTMTHGKNTENVFVQVYNKDGNFIIPNSIHTDVNTITITFNEPTNGYVQAILFLSKNYITLPNNNLPINEYMQSTPAKIWIIEHYLGYNPITRVYIDNVLMYPESIVHDNENKTTVIFDSLQSGLVRMV